MKKILSFMLALVMVASMAVVAFAEGEPATPVVETIYNAADFATNDQVVATPDAAKGQTGFAELSVKFDVAQNYQDYFAADLKAGNTLFIYYYVAPSTNCELHAWYGGHFDQITATEGYHVAQIAIAVDASAWGFHMKNGDTAEVYVGGFEIREGTVNYPEFQLEEFTTKKYTELVGKKFTFAAADYQSGVPYPADGNAEVVDAASVSGLVDAMGDNAGEKVAKIVAGKNTIISFNSLGVFQWDKGYSYKVTVHAYVVTPSTGNNSFIYNRGCTDWNGAPTFTTGYNKIEQTYTPTGMADGLSCYGFNGEMYVGNVEIEVLSYNPSALLVIDEYSEYTFSPEELVIGSSGVVTEDGLYFGDLTVGAGYGPSTTSVLKNVYGKQVKLTVEYNVKALPAGNIMWRDKDNGDTILVVETGNVGDGVWEEVNDPQNISQIHWQYADTSNGHAEMYIKSISINKDGVHPVIFEWNPADLLTVDNLVHDSKEIDYTFDAEKVYLVSFDYCLYAGAKNATITIANKTVTLEAGKNTATLAVVGGADKIAINASESTLLIGDITAEEVGDDYALFVAAVNKFMGDIELDKTIASTPETAMAYVEYLISEDGTYDLVSIKYVEDSFEAEKTVSFVIEVENDEFSCSDTYTFDLVAKKGYSDYNANIASGDSAMVAIVALIAVISLAGVVIAKKKVASK